MKQKTTFHFVILLLLFSFLVASLEAQIIRKDIPDIINSSDVIFEGQVIRSDSYWNQNEDYIYTSHTIEISKIFKGDIICGTIEVITAGGRVGDTDLEISHNLKLLTGEVGLFFCKGMTTFELPNMDYYPETNTSVMEVVYSEQGFFKYYNDKLNDAVRNPFYNWDSLAQVYDVVELYTQLSFTDCNSTIIGDFGKSSIFTQRKADENKQKQFIQNAQIHWDVPKRLLEKMQLYGGNKLSGITGVGDTIIFDFQNVTTTSNNQFLEFDIVVRANDNSSYLDNAGVRLIYDNAVFGNSIYTNGNVTVTRGALIQSIADYDAPLISDNNSTTLSIYVLSTIGVQNRVQLTDYFQQLVHVKIEVANCHKEAFFYFDGPSMLPYCYYSTSPNTVNVYSYGKVKAIATASNMLCLPLINSLNTNILHGGKGEILTINGNNFGAIQGNGKVIFQNADDGASSYSPLDNSDIISWSNTQIQCIIPSTVEGATIQGFFYKGTPGSGEVIIMNDLEDMSLSFTPNPNAYVNIFYSLMNEKDSINVKRRVDVVNSFGSGGYEFFPNAALQSNAEAFAIVKKAANDWRCYSHINYQVSNASSGAVSIKDGINTIRFGTTTSPSVLGETARWTEICQSTNQVLAVEIDIRINNTLNWWYDTTSVAAVSAGMVDFYQVMLHEMGHGNLLNHVNDSLQVMWWASPTIVTHRAIDLFADVSSTGALEVMNHSITPLGCGATTHIPSMNCWGTNPIENEHLSAGIRIFPNPATAIITIVVENPNLHPQLTVCNSMGQIVQTLMITEAQQEIDLSNYPSGMYFISVISENKVYSIKIIKQ